MNRRPAYILVISFLLVTSLFTGCFTIIKNEPADTQQEPDTKPPVIISFTASPETVDYGVQSKLSWEVSGATEVTISPVVGPMEPVNEALVTPNETTTYTLTATNEGGESTASVTVTVIPAAAAQPDLIITDVWIQSQQVFYKIKNQGSGESKACRCNLYVNDVLEEEDYAESLAPGEERTEVFNRYTWTYRIDIGGSATTEGVWTQFEVKVCADIESVIDELNENNNCKSVFIGQEFLYDFTEYAHLADWSNTTGEVKYPIPSGSTSGAAFTEKTMILEDEKTHTTVLATYPQQVNNGWIQGIFSEYYTDVRSREAKSRDLTIPKRAKFVAEVGFKKGALGSAGVRFAVGVIDPNGMVEFFPGIYATYDGVLDHYEVDLSHLAEQKRRIILKVEAEQASDQNWAVWLNPRIIQEK
jgi:hypothetical protein